MKDTGLKILHLVLTSFFLMLVVNAFLTKSARAGITPVFLLEWGSFGTGEGQFNLPVGIDVDSNGHVYVIDELNSRIQKFDKDGNFLLMWGFGVNDGTNEFQTCTTSCQAGIAGSGDGQFALPRYLELDTDDNVYVTDTNNNRVQKFTSDGIFLTKWAAGDPIGVGVDVNSDVYISEGGSSVGGPDKIEKFDNTGTKITEFGSFGSGAGQLNRPHDLATGTYDTYIDVFVADFRNHRVDKFDSDGNFLLMWGFGVDDGTNEFQTCTTSCQAGIAGSGDGQFNDPTSIDADEEGHVYVGDRGNDRIQKFTSDGTFVTKWGSPGTGEGEFDSPDGIAAQYTTIYVSDTNNHRIQKFTFDVDECTFSLINMNCLGLRGRDRANCNKAQQNFCFDRQFKVKNQGVSA